MFTRAILRITRKRVRTLLLLLILTLIATLVMTAVLLYAGVRRTSDALHDQLMTTFTLTRDPYRKEFYDVRNSAISADNAAYYKGPALTQELFDDILRIDGVEAGNLEIWGGCLAEVQINLFQGQRETTALETGDTSLVEGMDELRLLESLSRTRCEANMDTSLNEYFTSGRLSLAQGRHIAQGDTQAVLISEALAQRNQLQVGDTIAVGLTDYFLGQRPPEQTGQEAFEHRFDNYAVGPYDLTIVGTFDIHVAGKYDEAFVYTGNMPQNIFFVDHETRRLLTDYQKEQFEAYDMDFEAYDGMYLRLMTFRIEDAALLERIQAELYERIPQTQQMAFVTNKNAFSASTAPLDWIVNLVKKAIWVILGCGAALLALVMLFWNRDTRREMGILLAIGYSKKNVLMQLFTEGILLSLIAVLLCIAPASMLCRDTQDRMLEQGIAQTQQEVLLEGNTETEYDVFARQTFQAYRDYTPKTLSVRVTGAPILITTALMVCVVCASAIASHFACLRMSTKELLAETL